MAELTWEMKRYWLLDFISTENLFLMGHRCSIAMGISGSEAVNESEFSWLEGRNGISHQMMTRR